MIILVKIVIDDLKVWGRGFYFDLWVVGRDRW